MGNGRLKIKSGSGCCPCSEMSGCDCGTNCGLQCRYATGFASLCGFSEFAGYASSPPKKYRIYSLDCDGTNPCPLTKCTYQTADCSPPPGDFEPFGAAGVSGSFAFFEVVDVTEGPDPNTVRIHWRAKAQGGVENPASTISVNVGSNSPSLAIGFGGTTNIPPTSQDNTGTFDGPVNPLSHVTITIKQGGATGILLAEKVYYFALPPNGTKEERSGVCRIDGDTCEEIENTLNLKTYASGLGCGAGASSDTPVACPALDSATPVPSYDQNRESQSVTGNTVLITANGECIDEEVWIGSKSYTLSDEDTEEDAIARAGGDPETWTTVQPPQSCLTTPAFITLRNAGDFEFSYRAVQTRVHLTGLTINGVYEVTVRFFRRLLGSDGPWIFFSIETLTVVADELEEWTPWIDVPNEAGWETRAQNCTSVRTDV